MPRITLLTDFGTRDGYVAAMKGVVASITPGTIIDDASHDIAPGDVAAGARALGRYWRRYPTGTVHVAVVDPGVGTARRAIAAEADRRLFVVPDNGLLSRVLDEAKRVRLVEIREPRYILPGASRTFHGRDVFAPAAAYLAGGIHLGRLGPTVEDPIRIPEPEVTEEDGAVIGEVVSLDRFGNLVTNLSAGSLDDAEGVEIDGRPIPVVRTYGEMPEREVGAIVNSDGRLEVAARDTSAADVLDVGVGTPVRIRRREGRGADPGLAPA